MAHSGLNEEKVTEYREEGFSEDQIAKLNTRAIKKIDEKLQKFSLDTHTSRRGWREPEIRLVLLGKTGEGKSATGNLLMGSHVFKDSPSSVSETKHIKEGRCYLNGVLVRLIDTPGFHDTDRSPDAIATEIAKVMDSYSNGIHGFLFVFSVSNPRFTADQEEALQALSSDMGIFGPEFMNHCFVILTHGNDLVRHTSLDAFMRREQGNPFGRLIAKTGNRVILVENGDKELYSRDQQKKQVLEFIMSRADGAYDHDILQQFKRHKDEAQMRVHGRVRDQAPFIEEKLREILEKMSHSQIKNLTDFQKRAIVGEVMEKVKEKLGSTRVPEDLLQQSIMEILTEKQTRLTSETFLDKVKRFAAPILKMAGQILPILLGVFLKAKLRI